MKTLCAKAGIEYFRFHPIRHCSASTLADANVQLVDIQAILGHERISTTDLYIKNLKKDTKEAVNALDKKITHEITHQEKKDRQKSAESEVGRIGIEPITF